jgi:hypothetical protein
VDAALAIAGAGRGFDVSPALAQPAAARKAEASKRERVFIFLSFTLSRAV